MSWWEAWGSKLSNPADNVVAAVVVLLGVAITAGVTLAVSALNRRHERATNAADRIFGPRAKTYLGSRSWLINELAQLEIDKARRFALEESVRLTTEIAIYGSKEAADQFLKTAQKLLTYGRELKSDEGLTPEANKERLADIWACIREFEKQAREDVQGRSKKKPREKL